MKRAALVDMAAKPLIPMEEFLRTSYGNPEPDCVDGELVERPVPDYFHSRTQVRLADGLRPWEEKRLLDRASEIGLRVGGDLSGSAGG